MAQIIDVIFREYVRIISFSVPPALTFTLIGIVLPLPVVGPMPYSSYIFLGLMSILSPFIFDAEGPDGFLVTPQRNNWEKGFRLIFVKMLELLTEWVAFKISSAYNIIDEPFVHINWQMDRNIAVCAYIFLLTIMILSYLRAVLIFPWTVVTLLRSMGFRNAWTPFQKMLDL